MGFGLFGFGLFGFGRVGLGLRVRAGPDSGQVSWQVYAWVAAASTAYLCVQEELVALACRSLARTVMRGGERGVVEAGGARAVMGCLSEQVELLLRAMDGKQASGEAFKVRLSEAHPRVQIK